MPSREKKQEGTLLALLREPQRGKVKGVRGVLTLFQSLCVFLMLTWHSANLKAEDLILSISLIVVTLIATTLIQKQSSGDSYLFLIASVIFTIGETMIYRLDQAMGLHQLKVYLLSLFAFFLVYAFYRKTRTRWENRFRLYFLIIVALFLATFAFGRVQGGAKNWIRIGGFQFQPSEFAKIPFVFMIASWYQNYEDYQKNFWTQYSLSIAVFILIALFFLQRELGTALVFFMVFIACQFAFETHSWVLLLNLALALAGLFVGYKFFPHVQDRVAIWLNPWADVNMKGYQIVQSLFAIAEGKFFGTGLGLGQPDRIPLSYSDFIFASVIEEMGSFMGICLILLFVIFLYRGMKIAMEQAQDFYVALAVSISVLFASQAFIMFAGVMKVIPLTGITVPFLTYGGSSLLSSFILLAILQVASEDRSYQPSLDLNRPRKGGKR